MKKSRSVSRKRSTKRPNERPAGSLRSIVPPNGDKPWMRYVGMVDSGEPDSSQRIDDVVYGRGQ
jgi:hypothetical protein